MCDKLTTNSGRHIICFRLEAYERNFNFTDCEGTVQQDDYVMTKPDMKTYKDVNTNSQVDLFAL